MQDPFLNFFNNFFQAIPGIVSDFFNWFTYYYYNYKPMFDGISLIISGILIWFIGYYVVKMGIVNKKIDEFFKFFGADMPKRQVIKSWADVVKKFNTKNPRLVSESIKDADKIFDELMKGIGIKGKSPDERLAQITEAQILNLTDVKFAHNTANQIRENSDLIIDHTEAKNILKTYQKVFQDFGLID